MTLVGVEENAELLMSLDADLDCNYESEYEVPFELVNRLEAGFEYIHLPLIQL